MRKNTTDQYLVETLNYVMDSAKGKKITSKRLNDGWEIITAVPDRFWRSSTVTFRKPNPHYVEPTKS